MDVPSEVASSRPGKLGDPILGSERVFPAGRPRGFHGRPAGLTHLRSGRLVLRQLLVVGTVEWLHRSFGNVVQYRTTCKT